MTEPERAAYGRPSAMEAAELAPGDRVKRLAEVEAWAAIEHLSRNAADVLKEIRAYMEANE